MESKVGTSVPGTRYSIYRHVRGDVLSLLILCSGRLVCGLHYGRTSHWPSTVSWSGPYLHCFVVQALDFFCVHSRDKQRNFLRQITSPNTIASYSDATPSFQSLQYVERPNLEDLGREAM